MPRLPGLRLAPAERVAALVYAAIAVGMWPSPLFGLLHVESAAVVAGAGFFLTGLTALAGFRVGRRPPEVLAHALALLVVPWALLTLTLIWRANCGYAQGLALFLLFAVPSVALAVGLAWMIGGAAMRRPRAAFVALGLVAAVVPVVLDLGFHPQFYTYNPVWGGVLGPIYDEELALRPGLFAHRARTLLWAAWLLAAGTSLRQRRSAHAASRRSATTGAVLALALGTTYLLAPRMGIVTTPGVIDGRLIGRVVDGPFVLRFDTRTLSPYEVRFIGETLRYRYARYESVLGVSPTGPVYVYLYPDADTRAELSGARHTSVTPVWLRRPQMHLLQQAATPDGLAHELAHVFAREFGMPFLRASPAVGLVEGLAVALEPPAGLPAPAEQVAAAAALDPRAVGRLGDGPAAAVTGAMDPVGFWTGRGAVSYTTAGAFVDWLLRRFGAVPLREAYRTGRIGDAYDRPANVLAADWAREIEQTPVSADARALAAWRFAQPSLLERRCPHHVPREVRLVRDAGRALAAGDGEGALRIYERALEIAPAYLPALVSWGRTALGTGAALVGVTARLEAAAADTVDASLLALIGDARRMAGDDAGARRAYHAAGAALPAFDHETRASLALRAGIPTEALQIVHAIGDPAQSARALEMIAGTAPAVWPFAAAKWLDAGDPSRARAAMRAFPAPANPMLAGARLAWRAHFARLAGLPAEAAREAASAEAAYLAAAAPALALEQADRAAEARWLAGRP
jgi:hypothetical protein